MQTSKLRPIFSSVATNHNIVRTVTLNSAIMEPTVDQNLKAWKEIPGPSSLPIIGQLRHFLPGGSLYGSLGELLNKLYKQYGPIVRLDGMLGAPSRVVLFDAEASSQILHGENFIPKRSALKSLEYYRKVQNKNNGLGIDKPTGLLTDHDEVWRKFRTTVNPIMLKPKTIKLYTKILDEVAQDMVTRLKSLRDENHIIKNRFDEEMNLWALESIGVVALGGRLNCLDLNLPRDSPARRLIQVVHEVFAIVEKLELRPNLWRYISTPTFKRAMKLYEELQMLSKGFIKEAMEQNMQSNSQKSENEKGVLEKLMEIDEHVAITMANDMLFAGVDTTSNTMTSTLYLLATNPEKQDKLRNEIMSQQERKPYLGACIKESMRIRPVTRGNMRMISKDYKVLGYTIPKNTHVMFAHQVLSLMEDQYIRPQEYIPERWTAEKHDPLYHGNAHPFAFSPFGFGVRTCIGRRIVELELETFLTRIIENFQVEWSGPPLKTHVTILNYTAPPYNFKFKDVNSK